MVIHLSLIHIFPDLDADYFAASLHKWLYAPIGTGLLYVEKEKIKNIYPMFAVDNPLKEDIRKFEALGKMCIRDSSCGR